MNIFLSVVGIYVFIALGFAGKIFFKERLDERSIVLLSIYLLQPMLIFWGLTTKPMDKTVLLAPVVFTGVLILILFIVMPAAHIFFDDKKNRSIATVATLVGNTGNIGIPLGIAVFGNDSVIYTSMINLANVFIVYTVGVYFYSRGNFTIAESLKNIFRLPAIWFGFFAIFFNLCGLKIPEALELPLKMGAYSTMVLQLMIFGIYLATVKVGEIEWKLFGFVSLAKFLFIPFLAIASLTYIGIQPFLYNIILLELIVPLAVMNVNLAALYRCKPEQVAFLTFATSVLFLLYLFIMLVWGFK